MYTAMDGRVQAMQDALERSPGKADRRSATRDAGGHRPGKLAAI